MCARRNICIQGRSRLNQIICKSILHVVGQAQFVEGALLGVVAVDPVCVEGVFARVDWDKLRLL